MTIADSIESLLLDCRARGLRPATLTQYRNQTAPFARFCATLDIVSPHEVTPQVMRTYFAALQDRQMRPASIRSIARVLKVWFAFCIAEGLIDASPMKTIRLPKLPKPKPDSFTADEVQRIVAATATTRTPARDLAIVLALLDTGARVNEFTLLTRGDVDLDTGAVNLRAETTKTAVQRIVRVGERTRAALRAYLATLPPLAADAPLWHGAQRPLTTDGMKRLIQRLGRRAGVSPCGPHKYRRTFGTQAQRSGMAAADAAALLGHSVQMLLSYYSTVDDEALAAAHAQHGPVDHMLRPKE